MIIKFSLGIETIPIEIYSIQKYKKKINTNKVFQDIANWCLLYDVLHGYITQKIPSLREKWDLCFLFGII